MCMDSSSAALLPYAIKLQHHPHHQHHPHGPSVPGSAGPLSATSASPAALVHDLQRAHLSQQIYEMNAARMFQQLVMRHGSYVPTSNGNAATAAAAAAATAAYIANHQHVATFYGATAAGVAAANTGHVRSLHFLQEEPKPSHSYIGLISMAILSSKDKKLVLGDIYQWILDNYAYFQHRGTGWKNSIRHNLSLNDCFIKSGRSASGKGHFWAIHPANVEDFKRGDFRRRRAQRKVRKHMGLAVPDDDDDSPCPTPVPSPNTLEWQRKMMMEEEEERKQEKSPPVGVDRKEGIKLLEPRGVDESPKRSANALCKSEDGVVDGSFCTVIASPSPTIVSERTTSSSPIADTRMPITPSFGSRLVPPQISTPERRLPLKRNFDMESLLAPEPPKRGSLVSPTSCGGSWQMWNTTRRDTWLLQQDAIQRAINMAKGDIDVQPESPSSGVERRYEDEDSLVADETEGDADAIAEDDADEDADEDAGGEVGGDAEADVDVE